VLLVEANEDGTAGGSYQCLFDIARSLDPMRFTPVALFYQNNRFVERLREIGIRTLVWERERMRERPIVGRLRRARQVAALLGAIARRIRLLRSERIELLHLNDAPGVGFDDWLPAARLVRIPVLTHARGRFEMPRRRVWHPLVRGFDAVVAISRDIEQSLVAKGIPAERIVQIYDGIDTAAVRAHGKRDVAEVRRELGVEPDDILVAMVGHLRPWKGQDVTLEAVQRLGPALRRRLKIVFVGGVGHGNEAYAAGLRETITRQGLDATVSLLGERTDAPAIMQASDIVLHASTKPEPFGLVVVEGMALGRAVVAAGIGGPAEVVTPESGLLFDPTRPETLAAALESLAADPEKRRQLGEGGRRRAEDFSLQRNVDAVQTLYRLLLARGPIARHSRIERCGAAA
jgi:glycosyltransferase involved in cell wall biosynthesis